MAKCYAISFNVAGTGGFPLDMLRYDSCHPITGEDASRIGSTLWGNGRQAGQINITHYGTNRSWKPTSARWSSFLWGVDEHSIRVQEVA